MQNTFYSNPIVPAILGAIAFVIIIAMIIIGFKKRKIKKEIYFLNENKIQKIDNHLNELASLRKKLNIALIVLGTILAIIVIVLFVFQIQYVTDFASKAQVGTNV